MGNGGDGAKLKVSIKGFKEAPMGDVPPGFRTVRFSAFELDEGVGELRKQSVRVKLQERKQQHYSAPTLHIAPPIGRTGGRYTRTPPKLLSNGLPCLATHNLSECICAVVATGVISSPAGLNGDRPALSAATTTSERC
jgi:hypothetical protein